MFVFDKRIANLAVIITLSFITFWWTFFIFHLPFDLMPVLLVVAFRVLASLLILKDYSLSWSKASQKTFLIKAIVYIAAFLFYMPILYGTLRISFLASELFFFLFVLNFLVYSYYYLQNKSSIRKTKAVAIYGANKAGLKLHQEFRDSPYRVDCFVDDDATLQKRSIDGIPILSLEHFQAKYGQKKLDLLVIAATAVDKTPQVYEALGKFFDEVQVLPAIETPLSSQEFRVQLKPISVEDLLARHPKDLDQEAIASYIRGKTVLITGAGGSIGGEISRKCALYGAKELVLLDHSELNLYTISQELEHYNISSVMQSVVNLEQLEETFARYNPDVVIHAAAYKHVPLVEENPKEAVLNNIIGTKNTIDLAIKYQAQKFLLISTDKAVRPTNIMGATKRVCELYVQNIDSKNTDIVAVRFGNVLDSSGSVIPKFKEQIASGGPVTVTHPEITRYFMLISEACQLVLQAASLGKGGEIFILDMGEPVKIIDLAHKMIELSGKRDIPVIFTGLRAGEKLYEELLIEEGEFATIYSSIMIAPTSHYEIDKLQRDIKQLLQTNSVVEKLQEIVPEFTHNKGDK
ncbi:MAG TPA: polysaccharide biosynthesis protein [Epsilonproteobacteria bacterium]|nr:polysaccharide biosynthesis protein [Campylobacterota bacterium]